MSGASITCSGCVTLFSSTGTSGGTICAPLGIAGVRGTNGVAAHPLPRAASNAKVQSGRCRGRDMNPPPRAPDEWDRSPPKLDADPRLLSSSSPALSDQFFLRNPNNQNKKKTSLKLRSSIQSLFSELCRVLLRPICSPGRCVEGSEKILRQT